MTSGRKSKQRKTERVTLLLAPDEKAQLLRRWEREGSGLTFTTWIRKAMLTPTLTEKIIKGAAERGLADPTHPFIKSFLDEV